MSATVWVTKTRHNRFHASPNCRSLNNGRTAGELVERPLSELKTPVPCRWCYPLAPRLRVWHPLCQICEHQRPTPCPHNGGVEVELLRFGAWTGQVGTSTHDPDEVVVRRRWVWPENAWRYTLVDSELIS